MSYDANKFEKLQALEELAKRASAAITAAATDATDAIKGVTYENNALKFYTNKAKTGDPLFTANLPEEMFLDQTKTEFVSPFAWSAEKYPGSTDPNLDGKPVMVLAVKGDDGDTFSFLNVEKLMNIYTAGTGDGSATVTIDGYEISVNVELSTDPDNIITKDASGKLLAKHQDISGKADKVQNATNGNFAGLDANGNLTDSGKKASDFVEAETGKRLMTDEEGTKLGGISEGATKTEASTTNGNIKIDGQEVTVAQAATMAEVNEMLEKYFPTNSGN